jgi:hypothetical protein
MNAKVFLNCYEKIKISNIRNHKDMLTNRLVFGIILDLKFKIECEGEVCSYEQIKSIISLKYGESRAREI